MRALVTGGHGFLGSHLVERLLARGVSVRCLVRGAARPAALVGLDVEVLPGDVREPATLPPALAGVDHVFHLAALTRSLTRGQMFATNAQGTRNLLEASAQSALPGRFVLCSSLAAAGPAPEGGTVDEHTPPRPLTWYGASKLAAERAALRASGTFEVVVVRPAAVYGPRDRDFLAVFRAARRGLLPVLGDPAARFHFAHASDVAEALALAAEAEGLGGRTFHVAHPEALGTLDFLRHGARAVGRRGRPVRVPDATLSLLARTSETLAQLTGRPPLLSRQRLREMGGRRWLCDPEPLTRLTGWRAALDAAEGTVQTARWYAEAGWLPPVVGAHPPPRG